MDLMAKYFNKLRHNQSAKSDDNIINHINDDPILSINDKNQKWVPKKPLTKVTKVESVIKKGLNQIQEKKTDMETNPVEIGRSGPVAWPMEDQSVIDWFMKLETPTEPFYLEPHIRIIDPEKFFESLQREIVIGPSCPRGRTGALICDLNTLRKKLH